MYEIFLFKNITNLMNKSNLLKSLFICQIFNVIPSYIFE